MLLCCWSFDVLEGILYCYVYEVVFSDFRMEKIMQNLCSSCITCNILQILFNHPTTNYYSFILSVFYLFIMFKINVKIFGELVVLYKFNLLWLLATLAISNIIFNELLIKLLVQNAIPYYS